MDLSKAQDIIKAVFLNSTNNKKNPEGFLLDGFIDIQGIHVKIENQKGSTRSGKDPDGNEWLVEMKNHYGYISRTKGVDGEHVDCYVGDNDESSKVFIVHQVSPWNGKYDEDKCMLGFKTAAEAKKAYLAHYDSPKFFGSMTEMTIEQFKKSLKKYKGMKLKKAIDTISSNIISPQKWAEHIVKGEFVSDEDIQKGVTSKAGLVQKKVWVSKNGRTYQTTVWVKEGEDAEKKVKSKATDVPVGENIAENVLGMGIKRYSDKAVLVTGNTYDNINALREVKAQTGAGNYNRKLNGWIFPVKYLGNLLGQLISNSEHEQRDNGEADVSASIANENRTEVKNAIPVGTPVSTGIGKGEVSGISHNGDKVEYTVKLATGKTVDKLDASDFNVLPQTDDKKVQEALNAANPTNRSATQKAIGGTSEATILDQEISSNKGKEEVVFDLQKKRQSFINRLKGLATPKKAGEASKKEKSGGYSARASMTKADLNAMLEEMGMMSVEDFYKATFGESPKFEAIKKADAEVDPEARSKAMMGNKNALGKGRGEKEKKVVDAAKKIESEADFLKRNDKYGKPHSETVERYFKKVIEEVGQVGRPQNFKEAIADVRKQAESYRELDRPDHARVLEIVANKIEKAEAKYEKDLAEKQAKKEKERQDAIKEAEKKQEEKEVKTGDAKKDAKKQSKTTTSGEGTRKRFYSESELIDRNGLSLGTEEYRAKEGWGTTTMIRKTVMDESGKVIARGSLLTIIGELVRQGRLSNEEVEAFVKGAEERYEESKKDWEDNWVSRVVKNNEDRRNLDRDQKNLLMRSDRSKMTEDPKVLAAHDEYTKIKMAQSVLRDRFKEMNDIKGAHLANIQFEIKETKIKNLATGKEIVAQDYRELPVNQMRLYTAKNVLDTARPNWIPEVSDTALKRRSYSHDAIRLPSGDYLVAMNGFSKKDDYSKVSDEDMGFHIMSREHFAAMSDYYITRQKALYKKEADDQNKANKEKEAKWDDAMKARYPGGYKKVGAKRVKLLKPREYLTSQTNMLKEFVNPDLTRQELFNSITEMKNDLGIAWNDFTVSNEDYSGTYQKGKETSYGDSGTKDTLLKSHGILVKKQNGDEIDSGTTGWIKDRMNEVYASFGNRSETAKEWGLKVSHAGDKRQHASKAIGMFIPAFNAIGVSESFGSEKGGFTLAHEFAHFMDYQMAKKTDGGKRYFASHDTGSTAGKIAVAMRNNLNDRGLAEHKYFGNSHECFARAMEQYHAMKHGGDDVQKIDKTYSESPEQVEKETFNKEIKPLIEQFIKETKDIMKSAMNDLIIFEAQKLK